MKDLMDLIALAKKLNITTAGEFAQWLKARA